MKYTCLGIDIQKTTTSLFWIVKHKWHCRKEKLECKKECHRERERERMNEWDEKKKIKKKK